MTITKFERLRICQAAFLENIQKTQTSDIAVLDFVDEKLGMQTLRQLIMNIRDADGVRAVSYTHLTLPTIYSV